MPISVTGTWTRRDGFTLVEMAVVLVILAVVASLVLPRLGGFGRHNLDADAQRLALTVKTLYNEAALSGETHLLLLELERGRFTVRRLVNKGEFFEEQQVGEPRELRSGVRFRDIWVRDQGVISGGEVKVHTYPVGWVEESAIHLVDEQGRVVTVHLPPLAGMAEVYDEDRTF